MKSKTEAKRSQILAAAEHVFREKGFEGASMSEIRDRLGGSKATLYSYFPSKEKLFFEVMYRTPEPELEAIMGDLDPATDLRQQLVSFGRRLLPVLYSRNGIAIRRLAIAESGRSEIGKICFERAILPIERRVEDFLRNAVKHGTLRRADPRIAALHLLSLLEAEHRERILLGILDTPKPEALQAAVRRAVEVFLAAYAAS